MIFGGSCVDVLDQKIWLDISLRDFVMFFDTMYLSQLLAVTLLISFYYYYRFL